ncbi:MAG: MXAN_5808 family serine peptidase [Candidatus Anammoxibacter sp.]
MLIKINKKGVLRLFLSLIIVFVVIASLNYETFCKIFTKVGVETDGKTNFRLVDIVCSYVEKLYVYPDKIKPKKMFYNALYRLEKSIPELLVVVNEDSGMVSIKMDNKSIRLDTKNVKNLKDTSSVLKKAFTFIVENKLTEKKSAEDIMYEGLNGMLTQLDPHTVVLPPKDFNEFKIGTSGKFGGLGMVVGIRDGVLTVISPIEGTPADKAGLEAGDQIIEIDGESTINMTLSESVSKLRGKPNTLVTISLIKYKAAEPQTISIERKIIKIPTVDDQILEDGIGYIKIRNFQNDTSEALREHIENLKSSNKGIRGMIIDLRNNSGGLLDQAIQVADQFIDSGNIVITVGPGGRNKDIQKARKSKFDELDFPIVLLINSNSASGAEIVVGALKENNRGVVIGNRSFGKGSVQQLIELIDGAALKLTMAKYLTPLFNEVNAKGITPDILFSPVRISDENIDLFKEYSYIREEDLLKDKNTNNAAKPDIEKEKPDREIRYLLETIKESEKEKGKEKPSFADTDPYKAGDLSKDRLVQFAKLLVKNTQKFERNEILKDITHLLKEVKEAEEEKIFNALKETGIDWSNGKPEGGVPEPTASLSIELASNQSKEVTTRNVTRVKAGEELTITVNISNNGKAPMYRARCITESKNFYLDNLEFVFGKIKNGETKSYAKTVKIPKNAIDREDEMTVKFGESNGFAPDDLKNTIRIESLMKPRFAFSYQISDKSIDGKTGNNDGLIQKNENINLSLIIRNIGERAAGTTSVSLNNVSEDSIFIEKGREKIGEFLPGETKTVNMEFKVKNEASFKDFSMDVLIRESTFGAYILSTLTFQVTEDDNMFALSKVPALLKVTKNNTPVFGVRWDETEQITSLDMGTIVESDGKAQGLYRINLPSKKYGWIQESNVEEGNFKKPSSLGNIEFTMQHIPPEINLDTHNMELLSDLEKFVITGTINDDKAVKSVYAFVNNRKVFYKSGYTKKKKTNNGWVLTEQETKTEKTLDFSTEIILKEGPNTVTIIAQDNEGLTVSKSLVITKRIPNVDQRTVLSNGR